MNKNSISNIFFSLLEIRIPTVPKPTHQPCTNYWMLPNFLERDELMDYFRGVLVTLQVFLLIFILGNILPPHLENNEQEIINYSNIILSIFFLILKTSHGFSTLPLAEIRCSRTNNVQDQNVLSQKSEQDETI